MQLQDAAGVAAVWAPEVVQDQLQAFRSSDDLLSFFTELKDLLHVSRTDQITSHHISSSHTRLIKCLTLT